MGFAILPIFLLQFYHDGCEVAASYAVSDSRQDYLDPRSDYEPKKSGFWCILNVLKAGLLVG